MGTTPVADEREATALELRRLAGAFVSLGEAYGRRFRARRWARNAVVRCGEWAGGACAQLAFLAAGKPLSPHAIVEARLISVYGADEEIPSLARTMALEVEKRVS